MSSIGLIGRRASGCSGAKREGRHFLVGTLVVVLIHSAKISRLHSAVIITPQRRAEKYKQHQVPLPADKRSDANSNNNNNNNRKPHIKRSSGSKRGGSYWRARALAREKEEGKGAFNASDTLGARPLCTYYVTRARTVACGSGEREAARAATTTITATTTTTIARAYLGEASEGHVRVPGGQSSSIATPPEPRRVACVA